MTEVVTSIHHEAVMADQVCAMLLGERPGVYVDCTLGGGGHARALLQAESAVHTVIGIDCDPACIVAARHWGHAWHDRFVPRQANFRDLSRVLAALGQSHVDGILLDLGVSSYQLDTAGRGFSFLRDGPLDMRMDPSLPDAASSLVNQASAEQLSHIFHSLGEERWAKRVARAILTERNRTPITRTSHLADLVAQTIPRNAWTPGRHPATRIFQALRIAVNGELQALDEVLPQAVAVLRPGGRVVVIAYHSLEDRRTKRFFAQEAKGCRCPARIPQCVCGQQPRLRLITHKPLRPTPEEVQRNQRSRSARLRVAEKLEEK